MRQFACIFSHFLQAKTRPKHQSDALEAVLEVPAIEISGRHFAVCEGGKNVLGLCGAKCIAINGSYTIVFR